MGYWVICGTRRFRDHIDFGLFFGGPSNDEVRADHEQKKFTAAVVPPVRPTSEEVARACLCRFYFAIRSWGELASTYIL